MLISSKIFNGLNGKIKIPGDKSISHRSIIIPSISKGVTRVDNILKSDDVLKTLNAFKLMGVQIKEDSESLTIFGKGLNSLNKPKKNIDLGNSGTSARLLVGLLSPQNFETNLFGDQSLSNRPMKRIIDPLEKMGAKIESDNKKLPITIFGRKLNSINYDLKIPSAQVKSGIILASLYGEEVTTIIENNVTRNHTEIMLEAFQANIEVKKISNKNQITIKGKKELIPQNINVPSDLSSAAFFIVAALINKNSYIELNNICLNPTRTGILTALDMMGANIKIINKKEINGEIIGDIIAQSSNLNGCILDSKISNLMIDEYPILSIAASHASSPSIFKGLEELKIKESNRLELIHKNLRNCGIFCQIQNNNLLIDPSKKISDFNNLITTNLDHRIAMSFAVMGSTLNSNLNIKDEKFIKTSFPNFVEKYNSLGGNLIEKDHNNNWWTIWFW